MQYIKAMQNAMHASIVINFYHQCRHNIIIIATAVSYAHELLLVMKLHVSELRCLLPQQNHL